MSRKNGATDVFFYFVATVEAREGREESDFTVARGNRPLVSVKSWFSGKLREFLL